MYPEKLRYSATHQWARVEDGGLAAVGITQYAQEQLGEIVYLDLPQVGDEFAAGEVMGSVESVKSISDIYCPVSGKIVEINEALLDNPSTINEDPYGEGWMVKVEMTNTADYDTLLTADQYREKLD